MKGLAPLALILVLIAAVPAHAQSAPPGVLARPTYCFSTGKTVPAGTPMSQLATVCPPSTSQSGTTCSYSYTCRSAQCAQLMGGWSRTVSETGPYVTREHCEEARMRTIPTSSTTCVCTTAANAAAAGATTTTGSLAGDALNLGANLWIAQNIKNPYTAKFAQDVSQSFLTSFFSSYNEAQRQRQLMNEALLKQQQEAAAKARLAEKQRMDALFARLNSELKLSGSPTYLALKVGSGSSGDLPLKLSDTSDGGQKLKLKLGNDSAQGAGINGLPGIYVGGPANAGSASPDTDGLKLKVGDGGATASATAAGPAPPAPPSGPGIPGLPGIYLNDVPPERAADLANAATNLSGPERQIAEDAALAAAQKNPALTGPSDDPFIVDYQNEAKTYAEAVQAQQEALQKATEAEGHAQASRSVVEYLGSQVDPGAQTEAQKQAFQQIILSADSDEALAVEARRTFEQSDIRLSISRDRASDALSGLAAPPATTGVMPYSSAPAQSSSQPAVPVIGSSSVVGLGRAKPPATPPILATPPAGGPIASSLELCVADATNKVAGNMPIPTERELNLQLEQAKAGYRRLMENEEHALEDRSEWIKEMRKAVADMTLGFTDKGLEFLIGPDSRILSHWQAGIREDVVATRAEIREAEAALGTASDAAQRAKLHDKIYELMMRRELLRDGAGAIRDAKAFYAGYSDTAPLRDAALWMTDWGKYPLTAPLEKSKNLDVTKIIPKDKTGLDRAIRAALNSGDLEAFMDGVKQLLKITLNQPGVKTWMKGASKALGLGTGIAEWYSALSLAVDTTYDLAVIAVAMRRLDKITKNDASFDQAKMAVAQRIIRVQAALNCYHPAPVGEPPH